jgi:hypothetical protein
MITRNPPVLVLGTTASLLAWPAEAGSALIPTLKLWAFELCRCEVDSDT